MVLGMAACGGSSDPAATTAALKAETGAFNIFLIRQFVMSVPREPDEAATIDVAGYFRILTNIIVPSIKPAMIVVAMFLFRRLFI